MLGHLDAEFESKWGPKAGADFRATAGGGMLTMKGK